LAGLAGALYAHYSSYIVPEIYVPLLTIYIFLALTAGGIGNNWGAVIGAFVVVFILESTRFLKDVIPWISAEQFAALREFLIGLGLLLDRKSTRLNSSHVEISYAVFCLKKKKT